jgi:hypothetical protein
MVLLFFRKGLKIAHVSSKTVKGLGFFVYGRFAPVVGTAIASGRPPSIRPQIPSPPFGGLGLWAVYVVGLPPA